MKELPDKYYTGMEFVEDTNTADVTIDFFFYSPALLEPFEIFVFSKKITGIQQANLLHISFEQTISKRLLDTLQQEGNKHEFIIGYISYYLPRINQEMLRQRYSLGHFLVQTYSTLDIVILNLTLKGTDKVISILWSPTITSFPPLKEFEGKYDKIHIRDFIDAGNSYLVGDYDDCIRKVITSAENTFRFYGLRSYLPKGYLKYLQRLLPRKSNFVGIVRGNIYSDKNLGQQVVAENLIFIYKLRNKIVHTKFKISFQNGWVCKKAIGTLKYLLQFLGQYDESAKYIHYLSEQFIMLDAYLTGINLDAVRDREESKENITVVDTPEKFNKFMFEGLRITEEQKSAALHNKALPIKPKHH